MNSLVHNNLKMGKYLESYRGTLTFTALLHVWNDTQIVQWVDWLVTTVEQTRA